MGKNRSTFSSLAEGGEVLAPSGGERADMMAQRPGDGYPRDVWVFLFEGITVPIAFIPAAPPPPPPTP
jgi:hypothetical protein